ncbi:Thiamine pyrophosphate enzyme, TPP binding domain-containing protein [Cladophialophora immunda]|nr:Thiamine pyrophosphate enzyme, TPP binding domain-containing protein [Cladophialophora immunda]
MSTSYVTIAEYLFKRLHQLGVDSICGVPGDYNLTLLDYIEPAGINWVGTCNELNAAYAADGYARVNGIGAVVTTFGVGELSAVNAIAGARAEKVPVCHIVGKPSRSAEHDRALIHHTLNDGEYNTFARMQAHITVAQAFLVDSRTACEEIDRVLRQCLLRSRPVYISIPVDMVPVKVSIERLESRIVLDDAALPKDSNIVLSMVRELMYKCTQPAILVDGESRAFGALQEIETLVRETGWPTFTSVFGKSLVDESLPNVQGVWMGNFAPLAQAEFFNSCDLILCFGPHFSRTNTFRNNAIPPREKTIAFTETDIHIKSQIYRDLPIKAALTELSKTLDVSALHKYPVYPNLDAHARSEHVVTTPSSSAQIMHSQLWSRISSILRPGDIILAETGTAGYGSHALRLPTSTHLFKPVTWLSIGYMLPAALGAAIARRDMLKKKSRVNELENTRSTPSGRTILFIGDGSFQMTAQELSTIIHQRLDVLVVLISNDGFTIERCIHGRHQKYNDVAPWRYLDLPKAFGADSLVSEGYASRTCQLRTQADLDAWLQDEDMLLLKGRGLRMVEIFMGKLDAPKPILQMLEEQMHRERKTAV